MPRLSVRDERALAEIEAEARLLRVGGEPFLQSVLPATRELLRSAVSVAYGMKVTDGGPRIAFVFAPKPMDTDRLRTAQDSVLARSADTAFCYQPFSPEPWQQNRAIELQTLLRSNPNRGFLEFYPEVGLAKTDQLRVLLCEEGTVLSWFGVFRPETEPFGERERVLLQRMTPTLLRRVTLEQQMASALPIGPALEAAIEALGRAAWVVDRGGAVQFANRLGRLRLDSPAARAGLALRDAIRGSSTAFEVCPLAGGVGWLVMEPKRRSVDSSRAEKLAARWGLTARETEVVTELATGVSNRVISARLQCAERTVELHVSRTLWKAGVSSRAALVASFWAEEP